MSASLKTGAVWRREARPNSRHAFGLRMQGLLVAIFVALGLTIIELTAHLSLHASPVKLLSMYGLGIAVALFALALGSYAACVKSTNLLLKLPFYALLTGVCGAALSIFCSTKTLESFTKFLVIAAVVIVVVGLLNALAPIYLSDEVRLGLVFLLVLLMWLKLAAPLFALSELHIHGGITFWQSSSILTFCEWTIICMNWSMDLVRNARNALDVALEVLTEVIGRVLNDGFDD